MFPAWLAGLNLPNEPGVRVGELFVQFFGFVFGWRNTALFHISIPYRLDTLKEGLKDGALRIKIPKSRTKVTEREAKRMLLLSYF